MGWAPEGHIALIRMGCVQGGQAWFWLGCVGAQIGQEWFWLRCVWFQVSILVLKDQVPGSG
jgi:hypothetical protein